MFIMGKQVYKAWFPHNCPDSPSRDPDNCGTIGGFHVIVWVIASMTRDTGSSVMSLGQTIEFLRGFCKQAKHTCNDGF